MPTIVTNRQTGTETDKFMAIGESLQFFLNFLMCDLQKVGQGHRVQFWLLHQSMANVKIYKWLPQTFALALTASAI